MLFAIYVFYLFLFNNKLTLEVDDWLSILYYFMSPYHIMMKECAVFLFGLWYAIIEKEKIVWWCLTLYVWNAFYSILFWKLSVYYYDIKINDALKKI